MKIGIDSYCFHRYFGELYENQPEPAEGITCDEFLDRAIALGVDGVSWETCFFEQYTAEYYQGLKDKMDSAGLECIVAWGHPAGLEGGENVAAIDDMNSHHETCRIMNTNVLRMVGSHFGLRNTPHRPQMDRLMDILKDPVKRAEDAGIKLAMENHYDFRCSEMLEMFETIDSPSFGMTFDTGNAYRYGDDPVEWAGKLAKYIHAIHLKDVAQMEGITEDKWYFHASTPVGSGDLDVPGLVRTLDAAGYDGLYAIEFDYLDPKYIDEQTALVQSVEYLKSLQS
ncbi:MAG: sugar phosphate isomerase/epimerase family protein [Phycisphaerae bacterium]|jgi:sugar phosphate isomerase/epimerase|nr:sugar phosphate isomerase/epimerase family protein [Phycisphaerae bacterium]